MSKKSAEIYITNLSDGNGTVQLFHQNDKYGTQSGAWAVEAGQTVGPLTVYFDTFLGAESFDPDYWYCALSIETGSTPGTFITTGSLLVPDWKECLLEHKDAGEQITFTVDSNELKLHLKSGGCHNDMKKTGNYAAITNVFVLMLENRSFDIMFGQSGIPNIYGSSTTDVNSYDGTDYYVSATAPLSMPSDPGHEFPDVLNQLAGQGAIYTAGGSYPSINNSGFAYSYATTTSEGPLPPSEDIGDIMLEFDTPTQLPVMYQLATEFALCDHWFSSIPGPTWPNRFFVHGASSSGLDHSPSKLEIVEWETVDGFSYPNGSIFDALSNQGLEWRLYIDRDNQFSDDPDNKDGVGSFPQVASLKGINQLDIHNLKDFPSELANPYRKQYTFIEPNYGDILDNTYIGGSSQHPMDDVYGGEGLIKFVYESIRNSPVWNTSLLMVIYDEHGGFYDSFAPPSCVAPNDGSGSKYNKSGFTFEQYGVRVPAMVISPRIAANTVDHTIYDHASVLATLERNFGFSALTDRDKNANDLLPLLTQYPPRTDCPVTLNAPNIAMKKPKVSASDKDLQQKREAKIPECGNVNAFLAIATKADLSLTGCEKEKSQIKKKYKNIETYGEAREYIHSVISKLEKQRNQ